MLIPNFILALHKYIIKPFSRDSSEKSLKNDLWKQRHFQMILRSVIISRYVMDVTPVDERNSLRNT